MSEVSYARTLSGLLRDSNAENWSARRIAQEAHKHGIAVSYTSIAKYLRNVPQSPSESVLEAFSVALRIPMVQLREAAGLPGGELEPFVLPERANRLTSRQREVILHMVRVLLNDEEAQP
jgi:transcriptional regulator with XRE-family HTH domain